MYYKVVLMVEVGRFCSATIPEGCSHCLSYTVGKKTIPPFGGILAFADMKNAENLCHQLPDYCILEVEGEEMSLPLYRALMPIFFDSCRRVWPYRMGGAGFVVEGWPKGTVALRWCRPVRVVK